MKTYSLTFTGGDTKTLGHGSYFRLLTTTGPVSAVFYNEQGTEVANLASILQGIAYEFTDEAGNPRQFSRVEVTSASAQTITAAVGTGRILNDATSGNVTVTNAPDIGTVAAVTPPSLAGVSSYFRDSTTDVLQTILAPASNTSGVIVYGCGGRNSSGANYQTRFMAKTTAPTAWNDAAAMTLYFDYGQAVAGQVVFPVELPAGLGIYEQQRLPGADSKAWAVYKVL